MWAKWSWEYRKTFRDHLNLGISVLKVKSKICILKNSKMSKKDTNKISKNSFISKKEQFYEKSNEKIDFEKASSHA